VETDDLEARIRRLDEEARQKVAQAARAAKNTAERIERAAAGESTPVRQPPAPQPRKRQSGLSAWRRFERLTWRSQRVFYTVLMALLMLVVVVAIVGFIVSEIINGL